MITMQELDNYSILRNVTFKFSMKPKHIRNGVYGFTKTKEQRIK